MFSNPQGGKSKDFSAGKCPLLYFVVVPESLKDNAGTSFRLEPLLELYKAEGVASDHCTGQSISL